MTRRAGVHRVKTRAITYETVRNSPTLQCGDGLEKCQVLDCLPLTRTVRRTMILNQHALDCRAREYAGLQGSRHDIADSS